MADTKYIVEIKDGQFVFSGFKDETGYVSRRFDMKGHPLQEAIDSNQNINISLTLDNDRADAPYIKSLLEYLKSTSINCEDVVIKYREDYISDTDEINKLNEIASTLQDSTTSCKIDLNDTGDDLKKFLIAQQELENVANRINSLTINENGQQVPLSTFEKFIVAYNYTANRVYNMDTENYWENDDMRTWIGLLTSDWAICSGYASLLKCLCDRVFDENELKCITQSSAVYDENGNDLGGHANNVVLIKDDKYNINGCYYADSCWAAPKPEKNLDVNYDFCMIPLPQIFSYNKEKLHFFNTKNLYNQGEFQELYYDNTTYREVLKQFGINIPYYNKEQLKEIVEQTNAQIKQENDEKVQKIEQKLENLGQDEEMSKLLKTPYLEMVPKSLNEKYPEFTEIEEYVNSINLDNLDSISKEKLEQYNKFCTQHEQEINDFAEFAKEKIGNVKYDIEGKLYTELKRKELKPEIWEYTITKEATQQLNEQLKNVLTTYPDYFNAPIIDERAFYNGFRAVAEMYGITDETQIEQYAQNQIALRRQGYIDKFTPKAKTSEQQHEDEGMQR